MRWLGYLLLQAVWAVKGRIPRSWLWTAISVSITLLLWPEIGWWAYGVGLILFLALWARDVWVRW